MLTDGLSHDELLVLKVRLLKDFGYFARFFFKALHGSNFTVARHHRLIIERLTDVVRGDCRRLIINIPPRYGKCIDPNTRILTDKGLITAAMLKPGERVYSFDEGKCVLRDCVAVGKAFKPSVKITMRSGRSFVCSDDHPMLTTFGYKPAGEIQPMERIVALKAEIDGPREISDDELTFATLMIFDGDCSRCRYTKAEQSMVSLMENTCKRLGFSMKFIGGYDYYIGADRTSKARDLLRKYGIFKKHSYEKRLPAEWFALCMRQKLRFLELMFASDGYINQKSGTAAITLSNRGLIDDIQYLLSTIGIISSVCPKKTACRDAWVLTIPRKYSVKLMNLIDFLYKSEKAKTILSKDPACNTETVPYKVITEEHLSGKARRAGFRCEATKEITIEKLERMATVFPELRKYILDDFYYDRVESVESVGSMELVDIEVEGTHNFIGNGLVSHNTELAVRLFVAWCMANNPRAKFLHVSYSESLAMDNSDSIRDVLRSDEWKLLFPEITISRKTDAKNKWYTEEGGGVYAASFGAPITGFGAGISGPRQYQGSGLPADGFGGAVIVDDPMKAADALSETMRNRLNFRINNTLMSRLNNPSETPVIVIMQRLHEEDTTGFLLNGGTGEEWEHLKLSAINEDGTALWPEKHSVEQLERMRAADSYTFVGQYMQEPASPGGNIFQRDWFRFYDDATLPNVFDRIVQSWDFTFKNTDGADNVCGTVWGCKGSGRYLLDCVCRKMSFTEQIASMRAMCDKWPQAVAKYVEDKANGAAIIDALKSKVQGIVPVTPRESKVARAMAVTPLFEAGNVYFPQRTKAPWIGEFMDELATFPNAKHDDRVDSTTQALSQTTKNYMRIWD